MRHYLFLSITHAIQKYTLRRHAREGIEDGFHGWRIGLEGVVATTCFDLLELPVESARRLYVSDEQLDASDPLRQHVWAEAWAERVRAARRG